MYPVRPVLNLYKYLNMKKDKKICKVYIIVKRSNGMYIIGFNV